MKGTKELFAYSFPDMSAPANAKSHNCFEQREGVPDIQPVRNSSWINYKPFHLADIGGKSHPVRAFRACLRGTVISTELLQGRRTNISRYDLVRQKLSGCKGWMLHVTYKASQVE